LTCVDEWPAGRLDPVSIALGQLPARAGSVQRLIAEHVRLLLGLRQAKGEMRPVPYATSAPVRCGLAADKPSASRVLRSLVTFAVLADGGRLPPQRPGIDGTKLYGPPGDLAVTDFGDEARRAEVSALLGKI
jgi:hypothetical protein